MKYCDHEGYLVNAAYPLDADMKAYEAKEDALRGGSVRCTECDERVLHFDGKTFKQIYSLSERADIYRKGHFNEALKNYTPEPMRRLYVCACTSCAISRYPESCIELRLDTGPFWVCAGHAH